MVNVGGIFIVFVAFLSAYTHAAAPCLSCVRMRVGKAEYMYGPVYAPLDSPVFSLNVNGLVLYSANGNTEIIAEGNLNATIKTGAPIALVSGQQGNFDECGAWLNGAVSSNGIVKGWYHAEGLCNYSNSQTHKSIAYCESHDGGYTYQKSSYPYNQVINGTKAPVTGQTTGNGDHTVLAGIDSYYYIFYIDWDNYGYKVARSSVSSGGTPGTWVKYYNNAWSQPGLGGLADSIPGLVGSTVHAHTSGMLIALSPTGYLSLGTGVLNWTALSEPLVYTQFEQWDRNANSSELVAYPALVPIQGGSGPVGNSFWLYYTYLFPQQDFGSRYLIRRYVELSVEAAPQTHQVGVELSRYISGNDVWATSTLVPNYTYDKSLGYMLTSSSSGTIPLYDCYIKSWQDHMIYYYADACQTQDIVLLRQLGWIYTSQQPNTQPLYRCFNSSVNHHSVSNNQNCDGLGTMEFQLGWILNY